MVMESTAMLLCETNAFRDEVVEAKEVDVNGDEMAVFGLVLRGLGPPAISLYLQPRAVVRQLTADEI
jgi:hypothetical protein